MKEVRGIFLRDRKFDRYQQFLRRQRRLVNAREEILSRNPPLAGLAAQAIVEGDVFADLRMAFFAVGDRPVLAKAAKRLVNVALTPAVLSDASTALGEELDPQEDHQASASMRRHLAKVLLKRCMSVLLGRPDLNAGGSV